MKNPFVKISALLIVLMIQSCASSIKVLDSWKADQSKLDEFKKQNILVIARTADNQARVAFEGAMAEKMRSQGFKVTTSYSKFPKVHKQREISEERLKMIRSIIDSEGFTGVVVTSLKDKQESTTTTTTGVYVGAAGYPAHYRGFYRYYRHPYATGRYYSGFNGYLPTGSNTNTSTTYVLETAAYNLKENGEDQLVGVVTSSVSDPKEAYKAANEYVGQVSKALSETAPSK